MDIYDKVFSVYQCAIYMTISTIYTRVIITVLLAPMSFVMISRVCIIKSWLKLHPVILFRDKIANFCIRESIFDRRVHAI